MGATSCVYRVRWKTEAEVADGTVSEAQGYLFSRPVPAVRIRQLLNASHGRRMNEDQLILLPSRSIA